MHKIPLVIAALATAFAPLAAADDGGTRSTATVLTFGLRMDASLDSSDDRDVFRIDLQGRAEVEIRSSGNTTDTQGLLTDSEGGEIATDDDSGTGMNFRFVETLDGGVYYVTATGVNGATGDYGIIARIRRAGDDHGDTVGSSTLVTAAELAGHLSPGTDVDAFRIDIPVAADISVRTRGPTDTFGRLQDSAGNVLVETDTGSDRGNFLIERSVEPGIYYLLVSSGDGERGAYTLDLDLGAAAPCELPAVVVDDSAEGTDDAGTNGEDAGSTDDGAEGTEPEAIVYTRFDAVTVTNGGYQVGAFSFTICTPVSNVPVAGDTYTVLTSMWQRRDDAADEWTDIPGTAVSGQICPYSTTEPGQYRLVADVRVNGVLMHLATEPFTVE